MAANVNVKFGTVGNETFKRVLTDSRQAVKTLDAALKENAAAYKASGNEEEYLRTRTELLTKQIEAQEKQIEATEFALDKMVKDGADPASAAYLKLQEQLVNSKTALIDMKSALSAGTDEEKKAGSAADDLANKLSSIDKKVTFNTVLNGLRTVKDLATSVVGAIKNAALGVWNFEADAAATADDLITTSKKYGIDVETLQQMQYAAKFTDVSVDQMIKAHDKLMNASKGNGQYKIGDYGFSSPNTGIELVWDAVEALNMVTDAEARDQIAQDMFGKSFRELLPMMQERTTWYERMAEAQEKGVFATEDDLKSLSGLQDALDELDAKWQSSKLMLAADFAEPAQKIAEALALVLDKIVQFMESENGKRLIDGLADTVTNFAESLTSEKISKAVETIANIITKVGEFFGIIEAEHPNKDNNFLIGTRYSATTAWAQSPYWGGDTKKAVDAWLSLPLATQNKISNAAPEDSIRMMDEIIAGFTDYEIDEQKLREKGEKITDSVADGIVEQAEAAYNSGAYVGGQAVAGFINGAGGGGSTYNNTNLYIDTMNMNDGTDAQGLAQLVDSERARTNAGFGN